MAQKYPGKHKDSLLAYFIEDKTFYNDSDPAPSSTYFENKKQSFPWLYLDNKQWNNLSAYLDDPYFNGHS